MNLAEQTIVGRIDFGDQQKLVAAAHDIAKRAPLLLPMLEGMTVEVTNAGRWGWWWGKNGPEYIERHPMTGRVWPSVPEAWAVLFSLIASDDRMPTAHIVWYAPGAKLGEHRDKTERDLSGSIVTVSLGNTARWSVRDEDGKLHRTVLVSGDVTLLEGPTRHLLHSVDNIDPEPDLMYPSPLPRPGRLAISLRSGAGG